MAIVPILVAGLKNACVQCYYCQGMYNRWDDYCVGSSYQRDEYVDMTRLQFVTMVAKLHSMILLLESDIILEYY